MLGLPKTLGECLLCFLNVSMCHHFGDNASEVCKMLVGYPFTEKAVFYVYGFVGIAFSTVI